MPRQDQRKEIDKGGGLKGDYWKNPVQSNKAYNAKSRGEAQNKWFRPFHRTRIKTVIDAYDDLRYFTLQLLHFDLEGVANAVTAFEAWITNIWRRGTPVGNKKDLDGTQEANFIDYIRLCTTLACDLLNHKKVRSVHNSLTEDSAAGASSATISYWDQEDFDTFVRRCERIEFFPKFAYNFANTLCGHLIKVTEAYKRAKLDLPPTYFSFFIPEYTLAEAEAIVDQLAPLSVNAKIHMNKFGIPYDAKFSYDGLIVKEVKGFDDTDVKALCNHLPFQLYTNAANEISPGVPGGYGDFYTDQVTSWTKRLVFFESEKGPQSIIHALAPLLQQASRYEVDKCPRALLTTKAATTAEGNVDFLCIAEDDLIETKAVMYNSVEQVITDILSKYWAFWCGKGTEFDVCIAGDNIAANEELLNDVGATADAMKAYAYCAMGRNNMDTFVGLDVSQSEWLDNCLYAGVFLMYGK